MQGQQLLSHAGQAMDDCLGTWESCAVGVVCADVLWYQSTSQVTGDFWFESAKIGAELFA
jgi:hypothetical protein